MTCRCVMCGAKDAGSNTGRGSYIRAGVRTDETPPRGAVKRQGRRLRRAADKRTTAEAVREYLDNPPEPV